MFYSTTANTSSLVFICAFTVLDLVDFLRPAAPALHPPLSSVLENGNASSRFRLSKLDQSGGGERPHFVYDQG